ncbi:MAG: radical SAM protein [Saccharofermentans sp.]|nr:radical SAM protein [Saccharofermentans sp.]
MAYYCFAENWLLRSYIGTPYVLFNNLDKDFRLLMQKEYSVLVLCDGVFEFDENALSSEEKDIIGRFLDKGVIRSLNHPEETPIIFETYNNRFISSIQWSITPRCNYRCKHCYMDAPVTGCKDMSLAECKEIIDQMKDCGVISVEITGGEPFVRQDFWEIVDYLIFNGIKIGMIYTNGAMLTDAVLDGFENRHIKPEISVSFDGIGWHDWLRGVDNAERMAIDALRRCKARGFATNVEMCLFKSNLDSVVPSIELLRDCGVPFVKASPVMNSDLWIKNACGNELSEEEYFDYVVNNMNLFFDNCFGIEILFGSVIDISVDKDSYYLVSDKKGDCELCKNSNICNSIKQSVYISPEGRVFPCMAMSSCDDKSIFDSLSDYSLQKLLTSGKIIKYNKSKVSDFFEKNQECNNCEYKYRCFGGCRANAVLQGDKDIWGKDIYSCLIFKEKYIDKFEEAAKNALNRRTK